MVLESEIDRQLSNILKNYTKGQASLDLLLQDVEVTGLLEQANIVSITRMGFNDHGRVHAKVVALNALRIYVLLQSQGVPSNIIREEVGNEDDTILALLVGSYLHDIGNSISRESHDLLGVILSRDILSRIIPKIYSDPKQASHLTSVILEEILCHLGAYRATSLEAKIVATADGTDMAEGRARIPYRIAKPDIHKFSALAIQRVEISKGTKKPVRITVHMNDTAGIFQIEQQLLQKIRDVGFDEYVEVLAKIADGREVPYLLE